jgi:NUMOD4 motif
MTDDDLGEAWAEIADFEGYYRISNRGQVMSLPRTIPVRGQSRRHLRGRVLRPSVRRSDGRKHVTLSRNGVIATRTVDRLMKEAGFQP